MAWVIDEARLGVIPLAISAASTDMPLGHALPPIGTRVRAYEPVYGESEFTLAFGVASQVVGDLTLLNTFTGLATRGLTTQRGTFGIAMASNTSTTALSWYLTRGNAPVRSTAAVIGNPMYESAGAGVALSTVSATNMLGGATFSSVHNFTITSKTVSSVNGSANLIVSNIDGLFIGMAVSGTGISGTITAIGYGGTFTGAVGPGVGIITISAAATATGTVTATLTGTGYAVASIGDPVAQGLG